MVLTSVLTAYYRSVLDALFCFCIKHVRIMVNSASSFAQLSSDSVMVFDLDVCVFFIFLLLYFMLKRHFQRQNIVSSYVGNNRFQLHYIAKGSVRVRSVYYFV